MDNNTNNKAVIAKGAHFKGQIKNARTIEINGKVEADLSAEKVTIGTDGKFVGAIKADLVVVSGHYDGNMNAASIWSTSTAHISGKIQYNTLQMDRGAALNCRVVHNWDSTKPSGKKSVGKNDTVKEDLDPDVKPLSENDDKASQSQTNMNAGNDGVQPKDSEVTKDLTMLTSIKENKEDSKKKLASGKRLGIFGFTSKTENLGGILGKKI